MNASIYVNHVTAHKKNFPTACEQSPVTSTGGKSPCHQWHSKEFILVG